MIFSLSAPSGGGKEFLKKALLSRFPQLVELCWTTTRPLRPGEVQGITRENVPLEEFHFLEESGDLIYVQELFNNSYGIRKKHMQSNAEYFLTELHIDNLAVAQDKGHFPIAIALLPLKIDFLEERLRRRGTESNTQIDERLNAARIEIANINKNRMLFSLVVEFTKENEHTVVENVCSFVSLYIKPHKPQSTS